MTRQKKNSQNGFTLLEVMVAVMLLAIGYVAVLESYSVSLKRLGKDDSKRQQLLSESRALEARVRYQAGFELPEEGEISLEGRYYNLERQVSESGSLASLSLVPAQ